MSAVDEIREIDLSTPSDILKPILVDALQELRTSQAQLLQYPFGFIRASFCADGSKEGRYLHVWLDNIGGTTFPHQHSCDIRSRLLLGSLTNKQYSIEEHADSGKYIRKKTEYKGKTASSIKFGLPVNIAEESTATLTAPDIYSMKLDDIHTTHLHNSTVITLIEKTRVQIDFSGMAIFPIHDNYPAGGSNLQPSDQDDLWGKINNAVSQI